MLPLFALLGLAGCALFRSLAAPPFEARVVPMHAGIEMEPRAEGSRLVYVWHVHDYDGTNHTLTWVVDRGQERQPLTRFNLCLREKTVASKLARPQLTQAARACAKSALAGFFEAGEPGETQYRVSILTAAAAKNLPVRSGSLPPALGAQMKVTSRAPEAARIFLDVESCLNTAQGGRSYERCGSQIWQCSSVRPMLHQFGDCLRARSYSVENE